MDLSHFRDAYECICNPSMPTVPQNFHAPTSALHEPGSIAGNCPLDRQDTHNALICINNFFSSTVGHLTRVEINAATVRAV